MTTIETANHAKPSDLSGKYLTFRLGDESYGLEILIVREIIGLMNITHVPRTPSYIRGVINLRGRIIPVVELRAKFELEKIQDTQETCIIVVDVTHGDQQIQVGVLVDSVSEVANIAGDQIEPPPHLGDDAQGGCILGMAKTPSAVIILLNINQVLEGHDVAQITALQTQ